VATTMDYHDEMVMNAISSLGMSQVSKQCHTNQTPGLDNNIIKHSNNTATF